MNLKQLENEQFLFSGNFRTKFFRKDRTSILLDTNILWVRGFTNEKYRIGQKIDNYRIKYTDIYSVDVENKLTNSNIRIVARLYKQNKPAIIHIPYIENVEDAVSTIRKAVEICKHNHDEKCIELGRIQSNRQQQKMNLAAE